MKRAKKTNAHGEKTYEDVRDGTAQEELDYSKRKKLEIYLHQSYLERSFAIFRWRYLIDSGDNTSTSCKHHHFCTEFEFDLYLARMVEVVEMFAVLLSKRYFLGSFNFCHVKTII
jgi:hypothetical protein